MNYKEGLKKIIETTTAGYGGGGRGTYGGVWGNSSDIGTHGGDFGNSDWYAPGDARNPFGLDTSKGEGKKKKKKKKKTKKEHMLYRRAFVEQLMESTDEIELDCALFCEGIHRDIADRLVKDSNVSSFDDDGLLIVSGSDAQIQEFIGRLSSIVGESAFEENYLALIGEMNDYSDLIKKPRMRDEDYNQEQLAKGTKIEMEHTNDPALAREVTKHHLDEDEFYYDKLHKMEKLPKTPDQPLEKNKRAQHSTPSVAKRAEEVRQRKRSMM